MQVVYSDEDPMVVDLSIRIGEDPSRYYWKFLLDLTDSPAFHFVVA